MKCYDLSGTEWEILLNCNSVFVEQELNIYELLCSFRNRMGNVQAWAGPLNENWHNVQIQLQHLILERMRSFGIIPVLPAFSGRVMPAFKRLVIIFEIRFLLF